MTRCKKNFLKKMSGTYFFEGRKLDFLFVTAFTFSIVILCAGTFSLSLFLFLSSPFEVVVEHLEYCYWVIDIDWGLANFLPSTFLKSMLPTHIQFWAYLSVSFLYMWCFQCFILWLCLVETIFIDSRYLVVLRAIFCGAKELIFNLHKTSWLHRARPIDLWYAYPD